MKRLRTSSLIPSYTHIIASGIDRRTAIEFLILIEIPEKLPHDFNLSIRLRAWTHMSGIGQAGKTNVCVLRSRVFSTGYSIVALSSIEPNSRYRCDRHLQKAKTRSDCCRLRRYLSLFTEQFPSSISHQRSRPCHWQNS
jgi:hypothetical protein